MFFFKYCVENEAKQLVPDHTFFLKKALYEVKTRDQHLSIYFGSPRFAHTLKTNCTKFQTAGPETCSILIF